MQEGEEWCAYHGRHRREHLAEGKCTTVLPLGNWCQNKARPTPGVSRCRTCLDDEAKREEEARLQREHWIQVNAEAEAKRKREQEEDAALRAQTWFPALERLLEEREVELRRNIEEWADERFEHTPYAGW